jgi:fibronectin-binding autotransporter adhesin
MKVHNLLVTGSLTSGGENITEIAGTVTDLSSSLLTAMNDMSSSIKGMMATTGSNLFVGTQTISGSIIPAVDNTYDLGSTTQQFRDLYLSSASLYIDGVKVLGSTAQELQITTDAGQSFKILEAGSDTITLQSNDGNITLATSGGGDVILDPTSGVVALKGTTTVYAGNKILSSDGNAIQFGNSVTMTGSLVVTGFIETQELRTTYISSSILYRSGSTKFGDELSDTHDFTGSLNISGSVNAIGSGLISGSSQITYGSISSIPSGILSGSAQVDVMSTINIARLATTGSNIFTSNQIVTGSISSTGNFRTDGVISWNGTVGALSYGNGAVTVETNSATPILLRTNGITALTLTTGQTATFASTVTTGGNITIGNATANTNVKLILNGVASKAAGIEFHQSGTPQWYIGNGIASEDNNFELYNSNGTMAMKIIKSTNAINFIGATNFSTSLTANGIITSNASGTGTLNLGFTAGSSQIAARITGVHSPSYNATGKIGFSVTTWGVGTDYGLTEVMAIDMRSSDNKNPTIWMNPFGGNIGVGTYDPTGQVHIKSGGTYVNSDSNNRLIIERDAHSYMLFVSPNEFDQGLHFAKPTGIVGRIAYSQRAAGDSMAFSVASAIRMTLNASGNLGVGTETPAGRLTVRSGGATGLLLEQDINNSGVSSRMVARYAGGTGTIRYDAGGWRFNTNATIDETSGTERALVTQDGYFRMLSGTGGIQFGGDTAAANALDDYEEGTWTPTIPGLQTSTFSASYVKIGSLVHIMATMAYVSGTGSGNVISGLPFTASGSHRSGVTFGNVNGVTWGSGATAPFGFVYSTSIACYGFVNNAPYATADFSTFGSGDFIEFSAVYNVL